MEFKKLALAAAVAALPATGFSMEALEDSALSGVTGQDGISISLASNVTTGLKIHDKDGFTGNGVATADSGALVISGFAITRANTTDSIDIDIDTNGGTSPTLNIGVSLPTGLTVALGSVGVADSGRTVSAAGVAGGTWSSTGTVASVLNLGSMTLGATTLNIQLGNEPQGNMIALNTTITGGISLTGFSVSDANSGGSLITDLQVVDNAGTDLTLSTGINIEADGLHIGLAGLGGATGMDVRMTDLKLGTAASGSIGDVELIGLDLTGDLVIAGH
ncbi:DUF6160 family protein [Alcanivorax sp.]|uniref:putative pilus system protein FilA n=1 Tax=Alcanivorax sp. TaxID=1872427 RepID=UPI0025C0A6BE|nr:DUF6160 family protein [Alcanivorax sp.]